MEEVFRSTTIVLFEDYKGLEEMKALLQLLTSERLGTSKYYRYEEEDN